MDLLSLAFTFILGLLIGNDKSRRKLQSMIDNMRKPEPKKTEKEVKQQNG